LVLTIGLRDDLIESSYFFKYKNENKGTTKMEDKEFECEEDIEFIENNMRNIISSIQKEEVSSVSLEGQIYIDEMKRLANIKQYWIEFYSDQINYVKNLDIEIDAESKRISELLISQLENENFKRLVDIASDTENKELFIKLTNKKG